MAYQDTSSPEPGHPTISRRKPHHKSRRGCVRCKEQRKKCDEAKPSCSRCRKSDHACEYAGSRSRQIQRLQIPGESPTEQLLDLDATSTVCSPLESSNRSSPTHLSNSFDGLTLSTLSSISAPLPQTLHGITNATDMALLSHYITHTSRIIPVSDNDYHVLHVCIPRLAFIADSVMASLLALSAICMARDILQEAGKLSEKVDRIQALFELGSQHHQRAFELIQQPVSINTPDELLANAILIPLYAGARQASLILLSQMAVIAGFALPTTLNPELSHCISLTRATHTLGLQFGQVPDVAIPDTEWDALPEPKSLKAISFTRITIDGPSSTTSRLFAPVMWSTCTNALDKLRSKVENLIECQHDLRPMSLDQACLDAVTVLETTVIKSHDLWLADGSSTPDCFQPLCQTLSWLNGYLTRQNDFDHMQSFRRTIMSFIHRAPPAFMDYICWLLAEMPCDPRTDSRPLREENVLIDGTAASRILAAEVFAHWCVVSMLLDQVWFIGDMGMWEVERLIAFMQNMGWLEDESWWPADMCRIKKSISMSAALA